MRRTFKKSSAALAAIFCASSLMFTTAVPAFASESAPTGLAISDALTGPELEAAIKDDAKALVEQLTGLSDDEITNYIENGTDFSKAAALGWKDTKDEAGEATGVGDAEVKIVDDEYYANLQVTFANTTADFEIGYGDDEIPDSLTINIDYTFGQKMTTAALNTVMGICTVFLVLVFLLFLISLFKYVPGMVGGKKETAPAAKPAPAPAAPVAPPVEEEVDDLELIAVITAAIAASEGAVSADGYVVRSIRKVNRAKR